MDSLDQFKKKQYLNLETFRKNGEGMKTPVWFAQDGETIYVSTVANSGKVKRIRNCEQVNIAACKMDGKVIGTWIPARAYEVTDPAICEKADRLLNRKYGLMKKMFDTQRASKGAKDTVLEITLIGSEEK
jgi:PPOX class probable F420-dependent enzyme